MSTEGRLLIQSKGYSISANTEFVLPLAVVEPSVAHICWSVEGTALEFSASFTPTGGCEQTLMTARAATRAQYADSETIQLESAGLLRLSWGHWIGMVPLLTGGGTAAQLSYDLTLARVAASDEEQAATREARIAELVEREEALRREEATIRAQAASHQAALDELRTQLALIEAAVSERAAAADAAAQQAQTLASERAALEAERPAEPTGGADNHSASAVMRAIVAAVVVELRGRLGREPTITEIGTAASDAVRGALRKQLGREPTEEEEAAVVGAE
jgi:hypothetical protein